MSELPNESDLLVIIDDLNLKRITRAEHEANTILIVDPHAPLACPISCELLQSVAGRYAQESDLGGRVDKQQLAPGPPYRLRMLCQRQLVVNNTTPIGDCSEMKIKSLL